MSLQRACVNCERCYNLVRIAIEEKYGKEANIIDPLFRVNSVYKNDQVYQARNEAMKALEEEMALAIKNPDQYRNHIKPEKALEACRSCTYEEPRIVKVVEEEKKYE